MTRSITCFLVLLLGGVAVAQQTETVRATSATMAMQQEVDAFVAPASLKAALDEVARLAGMSRAARRVSQALRRAPRGLKLPWHRVVNAQGKISFPEDSSGYQEQKDLDRFGYQGALDNLLWGEPM